MATMSANSSWDETGNTFSTLTRLYRTRQSAAKTAGYLSLRDTNQLREVVMSPAFQAIWTPWRDLKNRKINGKSWNAPNPKDFLAHMCKRDEKDYGTDSPNMTGWTGTDHTCHTVCLILNNESAFPHDVLFGPFDHEKDLEAWNRAYNLLVCYWHYTAGNKAKMLWEEDKDKFKNIGAIKPRFMKQKAELGVSTPETPVYAPRKFLLKVVGIRQLEAHTGDVYDWPDEIALKADPRVYDGKMLRDWVRRELRLQRHKLQIDKIWLSHNESRYFVYEEAQHMCRDDQHALKFEVKLRPQTPAEDIMEQIIPLQVFETYVADAQGNIS